jgi:NAD(P)H dehydrogenase (quinone)
VNSEREYIYLVERRMVMQVLVLYYSRSGRTKALAEEVLKGVKSVAGINGIIKSVDEVTPKDFTDSDGIIAGSPVYFGTMAAELKSVFDRFVAVRKKMENKVGAAFATSGHPSGGKETTIFSILQAFLIYGMIIVGDPMKAGGHYGVAHSDAIDEAAKSDAEKLGQRVAEVVKKMKQ